MILINERCEPNPYRERPFLQVQYLVELMNEIRALTDEHDAKKRVLKSFSKNVKIGNVDLCQHKVNFSQKDVRAVFRQWHATSGQPNSEAKDFSSAEILGKLLEQQQVRRVGQGVYTLGGRSPDAQKDAAQNAHHRSVANIRQLIKDVSNHAGQKGEVTVTWEGPTTVDVNHRETGHVVVDNHGSKMRSLVAVRFVHHEYAHQFEHVQLSVAMIPRPTLTIKPGHLVRIPVGCCAHSPRTSETWCKCA